MNAPASPAASATESMRAAMAVAAFAMATLGGTRSSEAANHILRVQNYVRALARRLRAHPRFAAALSPAFVDIIAESAPLHDMGTIGVPDRILLKPVRVTAAEFEIIKTHTTLARDVILHAEKTLDCKADMLRTLKELVYSHHEKWDGEGYPQGLAGESIPLAARLFALGDVYDALISDRVYRAGMAHDQAVAVIFQNRASHFDPDMVDAFIEIQDEFNAIAKRYPDTEIDMQRRIDYMANAIAEEATQPGAI